MATPHVFDVTVERFQQDVLERSLDTPVLLDFWAAWCGPCRTLGPVLEKLAAEFGGSFVLGKVDTEREQELAAAFQVRSIPFVVLMDRGRAVDGFAGALPEPEVRRFLAKAGIAAGAPAPAEAEPDPDSPAARLERAVGAVCAGDRADAEAQLAGIQETDPVGDAAARLRGGLDWLDPGPPAGESVAAVELRAAREAFLAGDLDTALDALLRSAAADRGFADGMARRAMLACFVVLGEDSEVSDEYRRRLTTVLY